VQTVLRRAGIGAVDAENDLDPYLLRITCAPAVN
jgi:hypothetical protein